MRTETMRKQLEKDRVRLLNLIDDKAAKLEASLAPLRLQIEFIDQTLSNLDDLDKKRAATEPAPTQPSLPELQY